MTGCLHLLQEVLEAEQGLHLLLCRYGIDAEALAAEHVQFLVLCQYLSVGVLRPSLGHSSEDTSCKHALNGCLLKLGHFFQFRSQKQHRDHAVASGASEPARAAPSCL